MPSCEICGFQRDAARECPHRDAPASEPVAPVMGTDRRLPAGCLSALTLGLVAIIGAFVVMVTGGGEDSPIKQGAWSACHGFVADQAGLAPTTLALERYGEADITVDGDSVTVAGWVETGSSGARAAYECTTTPVRGQWALENLAIEPP